MRTTSRFDQAIQKLYTAFNNSTLHPECACHCAVGNICDNKDFWKSFSDDHGSLKLNYVGKVNEAFGKRFHGYTPFELLQIERAFLKGCGYGLPFRHSGVRPSDPTDKWIQFNGLTEAIEYLCKLDGIANVMDYSRLFESVLKSDKSAKTLVMAS
ncbi:MAG: Na(+)-translocating NADH-quinone reductase subunit F [Bacteroidia bacterium]|nr:Na(+)-translocating NADH-quinone reductase subunit F [Bacteroidia bacterium]MBT8269719.1 Na(+)-translocating NADH-quinone reductase subunit F [Bacteroidia bacterium]NNF83136.1 Na(+)-translocating NADH-quinone reductase subunit F [Flavobacteriaceae bacterium]NNK71131.1 Na(+)-translocating NADH-quinone reductase subunit F [Flavobacteriaceae bacterium]NNL80781.1 Na(+)-translocating NADH-quinone reductase subunit F [Flavobacteriaceae bacterium]